MCEIQEGRGGCKGLWWGAWPHGLGGTGSFSGLPIHYSQVDDFLFALLGTVGADLTSPCIFLAVHSGFQCMLLCQRDTKKTGASVHPIGSSCENGLIRRPVRHGPPGDWVGRHCLAKCPGHLTLGPAGPATLSSPLRMRILTWPVSPQVYPSV